MHVSRDYAMLCCRAPDAVNIVDFRSGKIVHKLHVNDRGDTVNDVAFSLDARLLLSAPTMPNLMIVWDTRKWKHISLLQFSKLWYPMT